ncbi:maker592 [Drosophila busckii]|uniref:Maker592 n=1 Tax=Drosophila busckii TaxID=30019 RepID=A0A0M4EA71_DROBS|nr:maker592 [Drosophila busckii]
MINGMKDTITTLEVKLNKQQLEKDTLLSEKNKCTSDLKELMRIEQESKTSTQHDGLAEYIKTVPALPPPTSCRDYPNSYGIETIRVPGMDSFEVRCSARIDGGGWTVIMNRYRYSVIFNKTWNEYKNGFGDLDEEFWIGLDKLHLMTKYQSHEMIVFPTYGSMRYSNFTIANEAESYKVLTTGSLFGRHWVFETKTDVKFTTTDRDNDNDTVNCAHKIKIGWWYDKCSGPFDQLYKDFGYTVMIRPTN